MSLRSRFEWNSTTKSLRGANRSLPGFGCPSRFDKLGLVQRLYRFNPSGFSPIGMLQTGVVTYLAHLGEILEGSSHEMISSTPSLCNCNGHSVAALGITYRKKEVSTMRQRRPCFNWPASRRILDSSDAMYGLRVNGELSTRCSFPPQTCFAQLAATD